MIRRNKRKSKASPETTAAPIHLHTNKRQLSSAAWIALPALFLSPYFSGSYYEIQYVWVQIAIFLAGLIYWFRREARAADVSGPLIAAGILTAAFFFSALNAVHPRQAWIDFGKCMSCLAWVWLCQGLDRRLPEYKNWFQKGLSFFGLGTAFISLDTYFGGGVAAFLNQILDFFGFHNEGKGIFFNLTESNRLYGTFQYPNTAAMYWMAVYFLSLARMSDMSDASKKRERFGAAFSCVWVQAAFFLTISRGAFLIWIPALILFFCVMPAHKRADAGAALIGTSGAGFLAGALILYLTGGRTLPPVGWIAFATYTVLVCLGIVYITPLLRLLPSALLRILRPRGVLLISAILIVLAGAAAVTAFRWTRPLDFGPQENWGSLVRSMQLTPGESYRLTLTWENGNAGPAGHLAIQSQSQLELLGLTETELLSTDIHAANSVFDFTAPQDSQIQKLLITNASETRARLTSVEIADIRGARPPRAVPLKYVLLPEMLAQRFQEAFLPSTPGLLRAAYYRDAGRVFASRPLLGGGGGAWIYLYGQYQSYEYYSTTTHNYLLQLAAESGIPGVLGWLSLAALLLWQIYRFAVSGKKNRAAAGGGDLFQPACLAAASGLFVHSLMDFDFSYFSVTLLFWGLLSMLPWDVFPLFKPAAEPTRPRRRPLKYSILVRAAALAALLAGGWIPVSIALGNYQAIQYSKTGSEGDLALAERHIEAAQFYDRFNPKIKLGLAHLLIAYPNQSRRREADALADRALRLGWYDQDFLYDALEYYGSLGNSDAVLKIIRQIPLLRPLASEGWQTKVSVLGELAKNRAESGKPEEARELIDEALAVPQEAERICEGRVGKVQLTQETLRMLEEFR